MITLIEYLKKAKGLDEISLENLWCANAKVIDIVFTNYNGFKKSRSVESQSAFCFLHYGHEFGMYFDDTEMLWKLVDVATGKLVTTSEQRSWVEQALLIPEVWRKFHGITLTNDYANLRLELQRLIAQRDGGEDKRC